MGRFATLNADTKDLVNCLLPALASSFNVSDPKDIIPEDIRMRAWDCEKRDHIKDQTENDPRNWGVQFLKDLMAISRMKNGNLAEFQNDLRAKVSLHEPKHPWCRLADIKEIKDEYENPGLKDALNTEEQLSSEDSYDSYFEELVEPEEPRGAKSSRRRNHEVYEARILESRKRRKYASQGRLRRSEDGGFQRKEKPSKKRGSEDSATSKHSRQLMRRGSRAIQSDDEEEPIPSASSMPLLSRPSPAFSVSPSAHSSRLYAVDAVTTPSNESLAVQKLQAELLVAEAELRAARLKYQYIQAREKAEQEAQYGGPGTEEAPHTVR